MSYSTARETFDTYGGHPGPAWHFAEHPVIVMQIHYSRAHLKRWGIVSDALQGLVLSEEVGELEEALAGPDDAVMHEAGDVLASACFLATSHRLDFGCIMQAARSPEYVVVVDPLATSEGKVARAIVKGHWGMRGLDTTDARREAMYHALVGVCISVDAFAARPRRWALEQLFCSAVERLIKKWA